MKKKLLLALMLLSLCIKAQNNHRNININNCNAPFYSDGFMFADMSVGMAGFEVPNGSGKYTIFASNLWLGGLDGLGALHEAGQTYKQTGTDFWAGPLDTNGTAYNPTIWDKVWGVNKDTINNHISNYSTTGYVMPASISGWPGSTYNSINQVFAPFVDVNNNNSYDPSYGDYPDVPGDQALYLMFNDLFSNHGETGGVPLGVEIYAMPFAYNLTGINALDNTVFVRFKIRNRSANTYTNLYPSIWTDFDIGDYSDDVVGTDVGRNMVFGYNGDSLDGSGSGGSYGAHPPAMAVKFLNHPLTHSINFKNDFSTEGNPTTDVQYYQYQKSEWKDGTHLTYGGTGYNATGTNCNFAYPGTTDTTFTTPWYDSTMCDARIVGSVGPFTLAHNGYITLDVAYIYARGTSGNSLPELNQAAEQVQAFYDATLSGVNTINANTKNVTIYPNPAADFVYVDTHILNNKNYTITIYDINGNIIYTLNNTNEALLKIETTDFAKGMYIVNIQTVSENYHSKLIIK